MREISGAQIRQYNLERNYDLGSAYHAIKDVDEGRVYLGADPTFYEEADNGQLIETPIDFTLERMIEGGIRGLARQLYSDGVIDKELYQGYIFKKL